MAVTMLPVFDERADYERGFSAYFNANIAPCLTSLEADRQATLKKFWRAAAIGTAVVFFIVSLLFFSEFFFHHPGFTASINRFATMFSKHGEDAAEGKFKILIGVVLIACIVPGIAVVTYDTEVKGRLMPLLFKFFGNIGYSSESDLSPDRFAAFSLVPSYDDYHVENHITGTLDGIGFDLSQLILTRGSGKSKSTVFQGVAILLQMAKPFEGKTIVKNHSWDLFSGFGNAGLQRVTLEDPVFNKWFNVYSSDQVEARCVLTPSFMEQVMQLATLMHHWGEDSSAALDAAKSHDVSYSFYNNGLFMMIPCTATLFQPGGLFESAYNVEDMHKVLHQIYLIRSIIQTLKLDKRAGAATGSSP